MSVLAIDAGTTGVTAVVVDGAGSILASGLQELDQHVPQPGWLEHAPEEIWQATLAATREVLRQVDPGGLEGLGITNQRGTILLWDRETLGSPRRAIVRQDRRTADICTRLRDAGHEERVAELTGLRLDPCSSATKLMWLAEHEPHTWALVQSGRYALGTVDSYLVARMTRGTYHVTDVSNASRTLLLDLAGGEWSDELCALFGVPLDALPELVPSWGEVATTDSRSFLGLSLPIAGIAGDQQSALVGQTCFDEGDAACTQWSVLANTGTALVRSDAGLLSTAAWRSPDGGLTYALEGETAGGVATADDLCDLLGRMPTGSVLRIDGVPAADDRLCQDLADRTAIPVERSSGTGSTVLGAAFLAGLGTGVWSSTDELRQVRRLDRRFEPSDRSHADFDG
ncbi:FGGY family carbohydrate kinase [Nocardioides sp. MAHUQ-72]|uniref:FGGY family carbohydrate kinase n=1 Tax=unclassified Nocardioides TaxID=2615069 RepID=UPI00362363BA